MNSQGHSKSMNLKPIFTFLAALLLAPLPAQADLVAHFRFDDDLKDVTGQHDGRPVDQVTFPMAGHRSISDFSRTFADHQHGRLKAGLSLVWLPLRTPDSTTRA